MKPGVQDTLSGQLKINGCYFLCLCQLAKDNMSNSMIEDMYGRCVRNKWLRDDCFVKDAGTIYNYIADIQKYSGVRVTKEPKSWPCIRCNTKTLRNGKQAKHFTLQLSADPKDVWDPLPPDRPTNTGYSIDSYRELIV